MSLFQSLEEERFSLLKQKVYQVDEGSVVVRSGRVLPVPPSNKCFCLVCLFVCFPAERFWRSIYNSRW